MENSAFQSGIVHAERRDLASLKYRENARVHSAQQLDQIARSMQEFGWTTPVLIDDENVVIAGYGRVAAAAKIGWTDAPVLVARGWTEAQKRAYLLADNQIALNAGWDERLLQKELADLQLLDFDISLIGFDTKEIESLQTFGSLEPPAGNLADQFLVAPFSILDTRTGWWVRRRRAWLALGIVSELGRGGNMIAYSDTIKRERPNMRQNRARA